MGDAAINWRVDLESWAIPDEILAKAPEPPWGFPTGLFAHVAAEAVADTSSSPSRVRALEALPDKGVVLDVGVGGGAASLPLAPPAGRLIGVDESAEMLRSFADAAGERGVEHSEFVGQWPEVAQGVPAADVVVCRNVFYNVADLVPFVEALDSHANNRVVVELTERHPLSNLAPLWLSIHGLVRPSRPDAVCAAQVVADLGHDVHLEVFEGPAAWSFETAEERIALTRRRLCIGPEHDAEIAEYFSNLGDDGEVRQLATIWWDP